MDWIEHYQRLLHYEEWANKATLQSLRDTTRPSDRALRILMHVFAADRLWMARIKQESQPVVIWPEPSIEACEDELKSAGNRWRELLEGVTASDLGRPVRYTNTRGEPWESTVQDILMHVVLHSSYHRGQIASEVRGAGDTPAYTDFIHCIRQGFLD